MLIKARRAAGEDTTLRVVATGAALRTIVITGLEDVLSVFPTVGDALSAA